MPHNVIANYTKRIIRMRKLENNRTVVSDAITIWNSVINYPHYALGFIIQQMCLWLRENAQ